MTLRTITNQTDFFAFQKVKRICSNEKDLFQMKRIYFKRKGLSLKKKFEKDFFKMKRFSTSDEK